MQRDSLFDESIVWSGHPKVATVPFLYKLVALASLVSSVVALGFAIVVATGLGQPPGGLLAFSAWCATLALAAWRGPLVFRQGLEYLVTERHVIWRRGRIRRSIDRGAISYAIIRWNPRVPGTGDLVLVRAVPTGALNRTLTLTLSDVEGPDRLWAIVRGVSATAPLGDGERPLAQRLDPGERVLWSAIPHASPWTTKRVLTAALAVLLAALAARVVAGAVGPVVRVLKLHSLPTATLAILVGAVLLAALVACGAALAIAYTAWIKPVRQVKATRYFVTNRRVLIRRGTEELSLDRARIAYVITAPSRGRDDIFLVLDGPQARGLAASGAFRETDDMGELVPVFSQIGDAETVGALLQKKSSPSLPPLHEAA